MTAVQNVLAHLKISAVYTALTGVTPRRSGRDTWRGPATWRGGDGFNVSLNDSRGRWRDFVTDDRGGVLDLVQKIRGGNRSDALQYAADLAGVVLDGKVASHAERCKFAERRQAASSKADEIVYWRDALIPELNSHKLAAVESGDDEALARSASVCNTLENGPAEDIIREFIRYRTSDPTNVARLIGVGRACDFEARRITAEAVVLLACSVAEDSQHGN